MLLLAWLVGRGLYQNSDTRASLTLLLGMAAVLPGLTAVFAWLPDVRCWTAGDPA